LINSISKNTTVPIAVIDNNGIILDINKQFESITDYVKDEIINTPVREWLEPHGQNMLPFEGNVTNRPLEQSYLLKNSENSTMHVKVEEIAIQDNGEESKLLFIFDRSERERIYTDYLHMARLASLGKLMSGIIHEISNPLSIILGNAQLLSKKELPVAITEDIERILSESQRTSDLIRGVLSFSRKKTENIETFPIQEVIEEVTKLKRYSLKNNNIKFNNLYSSSKPIPVNGYRTQLMQVFLNLINNSEQAIMESGGKGNIGIRLLKRNHNALIDIFDTGPGIDSLRIEKIFNAFYTTKDIKQGTGLGLYISRSIVRNHGGELNLVESEAGKTQFQIDLPISKIQMNEDPKSSQSGGLLS